MLPFWPFLTPKKAKNLRQFPSWLPCFFITRTVPILTQRKYCPPILSIFGNFAAENGGFVKVWFKKVRFVRSNVHETTVFLQRNGHKGTLSISVCSRWPLLMALGASYETGILGFTEKCRFDPKIPGSGRVLLLTNSLLQVAIFGPGQGTAQNLLKTLENKGVCK